MLTDTHCHLTFPELSSQVVAVLERARAAGVERVINVATTLTEAQAGLELLTDHDDVYLVAGIHPHEAGKCSPDEWAALADLQRGPTQRLVGIGETGLDFHYDLAPRARQEELFRAHLELARQLQRPVVIHARAAEERVCDVLADYPQLAGRVVFHCYSAGVETTRRILDLGGVAVVYRGGDLQERGCHAGVGPVCAAGADHGRDRRPLSFARAGAEDTSE